MPKEIERQRAYWNGALVTVLNRGRRKSTIRTGFGFVWDDISNSELDFLKREESDSIPDIASFKFQTPTSTPN